MTPLIRDPRSLQQGAWIRLSGLLCVQSEWLSSDTFCLHGVMVAGRRCMMQVRLWSLCSQASSRSDFKMCFLVFQFNWITLVLCTLRMSLERCWVCMHRMTMRAALHTVNSKAATLSSGIDTAANK